MKTIQHPLAETSTDEIDLFALIQSLWQQKKLIAGTTLAVGAIALTYAMLAPRVYQASTVLRPAAINELDALNRSEVYKLPPTEALLKVGAALDSYETRFTFFQSNQDLFKPLQKKACRWNRVLKSLTAMPLTSYNRIQKSRIPSVLSSNWR